MKHVNIATFSYVADAPEVHWGVRKSDIESLYQSEARAAQNQGRECVVHPYLKTLLSGKAPERKNPNHMLLYVEAQNVYQNVHDFVSQEGEIIKSFRALPQPIERLEDPRDRGPIEVLNHDSGYRVLASSVFYFQGEKTASNRALILFTTIGAQIRVTNEYGGAKGWCSGEFRANRFVPLYKNKELYTADPKFSKEEKPTDFIGLHH